MNINATLFVQALSFAALIWFTVKFVWPMITNAMDERARRIADGLAAAEAGRQSLERSAKQATVAIDEARSRAADIISQAEKRGAQLIEEAKASARAEAERERQSAKAYGAESKPTDFEKMAALATIVSLGLIEAPPTIGSVVTGAMDSAGAASVAALSASELLLHAARPSRAAEATVRVSMRVFMSSLLRTACYRRRQMQRRVGA